MSTKQESSDVKFTLPKDLQPLAEEFATFVRELPRLLSENEAGRFVVVKGAQVHGTWDTYGDALQYGYEKFGLEEPFFVRKVDKKEAALLLNDFLPTRSDEPSCPS